MNNRPLSERVPKLRESTLDAIHSEIIVSTGNGPLADFVVEFLTTCGPEIAALEAEIRGREMVLKGFLNDLAALEIKCADLTMENAVLKADLRAALEEGGDDG